MHQQLPPRGRKRLFSTITWRDIGTAFVSLSPFDDDWHKTISDDHTTLRTGDHQPVIGDVIEIQGPEGTTARRFVTYVMGNHGNHHTAFRGQGVHATGPIRWRKIATATHLRIGQGALAPDPAPDAAPVRPPVQTPPVISATTPTKPDLVAAVIAWIRSHPMAAPITLLLLFVVFMGTFTDSLQKIITFFRQNFGGK